MARICCSSCLDCKMYSVKRKLILARFTTLSLTADDLPDQTLRQRRRTRGAWPDQTGPTAAVESGWWTAARARTEPAHQHDTHWGAADLFSKMQIYSLFLLGNYWKEMKCLITTITLRMISTGEGTEDKLKHVCESITYSNQDSVFVLSLRVNLRIFIHIAHKQWNKIPFSNILERIGTSTYNTTNTFYFLHWKKGLIKMLSAMPHAAAAAHTSLRKAESSPRYLDTTYIQKRWRSIPWPVIARRYKFWCLSAASLSNFRRSSF